VPLTASRAIVAPAVPKTYIVANNTTGGQVITIISTSSGTFVNVPVGGTSLVYCDAAGNFYEAITATSKLLLNNAITAPTQAATKAYVDAAISSNSAFPAGTTMLFVQTSAPIGWTQQNAYNDYALRVVAGIGGGTGGTVPFSTAFSSSSVSGTTSSTILNATQIPAHNHGVTDPGHFHNVTVTDPGHTHTVTDPGHFHPNGASYRPNNGYQGNPSNGGTNFPNTGTATTGITIAPRITGITAVTASKVTGVTTTNTGGGLGHTHTFGTGVNLAVKYLNTIVCIKN
jgi:hypothetical protein